jgi:hypothetical protein
VARGNSSYFVSFSLSTIRDIHAARYDPAPGVEKMRLSIE